MGNTIDLGYDIDKLNAQQKVVVEHLNEVLGLADKLDGRKMFPEIKGVGQMNSAIASTKKTIDEISLSVNAYNDLITKTANTKARFNASSSGAAEDLAKETVALQQRNKELKASAELELAGANSIQKAKAEIKGLSIERDKLNLATEEGVKKQKEYNAKIDELTEFIRQNSDAATKQRMNVGNYEGSAKIIVDALEREKNKLEELEKARVRVQNAGATFNPGSAAARTTVTGFAGGSSNVGALNTIASNAKSADDAVEQLNDEIAKTRTIVEGFSRVTDNPKFLNIAAKVGDSTAELKFLTKVLVEMERQGLGNSEVAVKLRAHLAELTDQIGDAKAEIKALSSDTRGFDLFAGSVSFAADSMQTFAGAAVLAGQSEEDVNESLKSLVAIQSVANGVKGIANELTTRGTAANKVYAFSQQQLAIMMDASATSAQRFKAALITTGFGALIVALGYLVANFDKVKDALSGVSKAQRVANETISDYGEGVKSATEQTLKVKSAFEQARQGVISKDDALKIYNDTLGDSLGKAKSLDEAEKNYTDKADAYIKVQALKAQANALFAKSGEFAAKQVTADLEDQRSGFAKFVSASLGAIGNIGGATAVNYRSQTEGVAKAKEEYKTTAAELEKQGILLEKQAAELAKNMGIVINPDGGKEKNDKKGRDLAAANAKAELEILVSNANERARIQREIADNENANIEDRLDAEYKYYQEKQNILRYNMAYELSQKDLTEKEKKAITTKYANDTKALDADRLKERTALLKSFDDKITQQLKDRNDAELNALSATREQKKVIIEQQYTDALAIAEDRHKKGITDEKKYQEEKKKAEAQYHIESLNAEIAYTESVLALMKARGLDVSKELQELAKLKRELAEASTDSPTQNNFEKELAFLNNLQSYYERTYSVIDSIAKRSSEKRLAQLQSEIDANEKKRNQDIANVESTVASEEEKRARIEQINRMADAQNEAANRKIREEKRKQAQFEKVAAISSIIFNTAKAIVQDLGTPWKIAFDSAIGAAQLAIAMATPLPQFAEGTDSAPEGWAMTDEEGAELYLTPSGEMFLGNDKPTIRFLEQGTKVVPFDGVNDFLLNAMMKDVNLFTKDKALEQKMDELNQSMHNVGQVISGAIKKQKAPTVIIYDGKQFGTYLQSRI